MHHAPFVHLHLHTYYSLLDGANPIGALAARVRKLKMPACAMTDHGNLFGAIEFYEAMNAQGVKPIIGCEMYLLTQGHHTERNIRPGEGFLSHVTLLARNKEGYQNLCRLSSIAHLDGFYYKPRIDKTLLAAHSKGLLCLTGCLNGEIARHLRNDDMASAQAAAAWLLHTFGEEHVYFEIMRHDLNDQHKVNEGLIALAQQYSRPLVATNDCHYMHKEDAAAHDILLCIQTAKNLDDPKRMRMDTDQFYVRSAEEMQELFADIPSAVTATLDVAEQCNVELDFTTYHFPRFQVPEGHDLPTVLREQSRAGLRQRWPLILTLRASEDVDPAVLQTMYGARLEQELDCICSMGFAGYLLIVADFIRYAKSQHIPVGPGRGSAAGSLVSYCLQITDIDPIYFSLFFERFLNPERVSMPDMDIDFCMRRRDEVIQYVQDKYGNVGQIITFGKMKAKAAIRDVARVSGISYGEADRLSKLVPNTLGITLAEALALEPQLGAAAKKDEQVARCLEVAQAIEGFPRHASTHAAGVVISDRPLTDFLPLCRGAKDEVVTQFDMKAVEKIGLIKFDFLGLKTLTILDDTMAILKKGQGPAHPLSALPLDDALVFGMLGRGDTAGVFQLESSGMTDLVIRLQPNCFLDIVALVALFRPGPLGSGMVDDFINRKHGRTQIVYPLPQLASILKDTYGVILYQEQVMQIASTLANYSLGEADLLRRAMGKKKAEEMAQQKERFLKGAEGNRIPQRKAGQIFDLMEKFALYGFNKAHSVAYALIAYQTAYFKAHHPTEYFAALLTNEMGNTDKVLQYLNDAKAHGITVLPPDVNTCERTFSVVNARDIRFGLAAVKNVGTGAIASILEARDTEGPFTSLFNCCERVDKRVNRRVFESLIKCGGFDTLGTDRAILWAALEQAVGFGAARQKERLSGQGDLFGDLGASSAQPAYPHVEAWTERERLAYEKEALGFYITGHPLAQHVDLLEQYCSARTDTLKALRDKQTVRIGGVVAAMREIMTKRGDRMAFVTLEDLHGTVEVVVFSEPFALASALLKTDQPICVVGTTDVGEEAVKIIAEDIMPLEEAPQRLTREVHFRLSTHEADADHLTRLKDVLRRFSGQCPAYVHVVIPETSETVMALPPEIRLLPSLELLAAVNQLFGHPVTQFTV